MPLLCIGPAGALYDNTYMGYNVHVHCNMYFVVSYLELFIKIRFQNCGDVEYVSIYYGKLTEICNRLFNMSDAW